WIHVDVERARRESPFGAPIAHGYLTLSLVAPLAMDIGLIPPDAASGLNYGLDKVRFIAPVKAGSRVRNRVRLMSAETQKGGRMLLKLDCTLEIAGDEKPALVAEMLCMLIGRPSLAPSCATRRWKTRWRPIRWSACAPRISRARPACSSGTWRAARWWRRAST